MAAPISCRGGVGLLELSGLRSSLRASLLSVAFTGERMNAERLTTKSRDVITGAVADAGRRGHATVEPWHMLLSLLDTGGSTAPALLRAVGANPADVRRAAVHSVDRLPTASGSSVAEPSLARELVNAPNAAENIARPLGDEYVSTEHLLAGLAQTGGAVAA